MRIIFLFGLFFVSLFANDGKAVFEKYCWGCHHQISTAFGPSFNQIANTRTKEQIMAHIADPKNSYKNLGYKRSAMPQFSLSADELITITDYIFSFKSGVQ